MSGSILQFPLRLGLAEDANKKSPPVSSLKRGHNIRWVKDGTVGKCWAFSSKTTLPDGAGAPVRFVVRDDELSVTDGSRLYTKLPSGSWVNSDAVCEAALEWETILDDEAGIASSDIGAVDDVLVHAWVTGDPTRKPEATPIPDNTGRAFVQILHRTTYQPLMRPVRLIGGLGVRIVHVRVLIVSSSLAFVVYSTADGYVRALPLDLTALTAGSAADLTTNLRSGGSYFGRFDAMFYETGDLALVYENSTPALVAKRYTRSGSTLTEVAAVSVSEENIISIAIAEDTVTDRIGILYGLTDGADNYSVEYRSLNTSTFAFAAGPTTVQDTFYAAQVDIYLTVGGSKFGIAFSGTEELDDPIRVPALISQQIAVSDGSTFPDSVARSMGVGLLSRSFSVLGGGRYVLAVDARYGERDGTGDQLALVPSISSYVLAIDDALDTSLLPPHRLVGKIDHDIAGIYMLGVLPRAAVTDGSEAIGLTPFQASAAAASFNFRAGLRVVRVTATPSLMSDPHRSVAVGPETYIAGARVSAWDGGNVFDYGMRAPFFVGLIPGEDATGDMAPGNYIYQLAANYRSRVGVLHRGPMSPTRTESVPAEYEGSMRLVVVPNSIDGKQTYVTGFGESGPAPADFDIFRSTAGGSLLYKLTYSPRFNTLTNVPNERYIEFLDTKNDTDVTASFGGDDDPPVPEVALDARPQPYVATGELEDVQPPAAKTLCFHMGRVFALTGGGDLWFTKDMTENPSIAPGFNSSFVRIFDKRPTAIASFVDRVLVFFERGAKYMVGDGPTVANTDDRFSPLQAIAGEVGTTNPRSIVATPIGLFFQSTGGDIYLFDGSSMQWIGKDARDTLASYPTVSSAVHVPDESEVRFVCEGTIHFDVHPITGSVEGGDLLQSIILVYDYQRGTWMTRAAPAFEAIADSVLCAGRYFIATSSGVWEEVSGTFIDDGGEYKPSTVVLNPISPSGPASWHRVKRVQLLGESLSAHGLEISIARDFAETTEQTQSWESTSDVTAIGPLERAQVALAKQKAQSIEVHITDVAPTGDAGTGEGMLLEGVAFQVQAKQGLARITPSRRG